MVSTSSADTPNAPLVIEVPGAEEVPRTGRLLAGLSPGTFLMLFAVGAIVCIVSLPRLAAYAVASNEDDARSTVCMLSERLLAPRVAGAGAADAAPAVGLGTTLATSAWLRHRLEDARPTERPGVMLYHGFYYALVEGESGALTAFAWPRRAGRTGGVVYACGADGKLLEQPNPRRAWSGLLDPRDLGDVVTDAASGWRVAR